MSNISGWGGRVRGLFNDTKGPWGPSGSDGGAEPPSGEDGGNGGPWGETPRRGRRPRLVGGSNVSALDELVRRGRARFGGGGSGFPSRPDRSLIIWAAIGF